MRWRNDTLVVVLAAALGTEVATAQTIRHVPGDYPTIQAGIDAAHVNDVVLVAAGTYSGLGNVDLDFAGKAITVRGENGQAIINDSRGGTQLVYFHSGETAQSIFEGFVANLGYIQGVVVDGSSPTIRNCELNVEDVPLSLRDSVATLADLQISGHNFAVDVLRGEPIFDRVDVYHCGVSVRDSNIIMRDCAMRENDDGHTFSGGGLSIDGGSAILMRCTMSDNVAGDGSEYGVAHGGGAYFKDATVRLSQCVIANNRANAHFDIGGDGAGVYMSNSAVHLDNCLLHGNRSDSMGAGLFVNGGDAIVSNCTIVGNVAYSSWLGINLPGAVVLWDGSASLSNVVVYFNSSDEENYDPFWGNVAVTWSDVQYGYPEFTQPPYPGEGNINIDPRFANVPGGDYRLGDGSPCIDAGNNSLVPIGNKVDLDGLGRFADDPGMPDMGEGVGSIVDLGAYEFHDNSTGINLRTRTTCPETGPARIGWANASPGWPGVILVSDEPGTARIPGFRPCPGTELGLAPASIRVAWKGQNDRTGGRLINTMVPSFACGRFLQFIDLSTCNVSDVVPIQ